MKGVINIVSNEKEISLFFKLWTIKRFCDLEGVEFEDGLRILDKPTLKHIINLVRAAAEYPFYKEGKSVSFTDPEICEWIEDGGGIVEFCGKVMEAVIESIEVKGIPAEKKSDLTESQ